MEATPVTIAGDVVHWFEDAIDALVQGANPINSVQDTYTSDQFISYDSTPVFKVDYVTGAPTAPGATPGLDLPAWFSVPRWTQYQFGILGSEHYIYDNKRTVYPS